MPPRSSPPPRKPTRAEIARANGARSRGPTTPEGKARASRNALRHGLRAEKFLIVESFEESLEGCDAHFRAVTAELGAEGVVAKHLAETIAAAIWRCARADRIEGGLLGAMELREDAELRHRFALTLRYRAQAETEVRRSLDSLLKLKKAQAEGLVLADEAPAGEEPVPDAPAPPDEPDPPREPAAAKTGWHLGPPANDDRPDAGEPAPVAAARPSPAPRAAVPHEPGKAISPPSQGLGEVEAAPVDGRRFLAEWRERHAADPADAQDWFDELPEEACLALLEAAETGRASRGRPGPGGTRGG